MDPLPPTELQRLWRKRLLSLEESMDHVVDNLLDHQAKHLADLYSLQKLHGQMRLVMAQLGLDDRPAVDGGSGAAADDDPASTGPLQTA